MVREQQLRRTRLNGSIPPIRRKEDPGGTVISVEIRVNGIIKKKRDAVLSNIAENKTFKTDDGDRVLIRKKSSIERIAARMLLDKGVRGE